MLKLKTDVLELRGIDNKQSAKGNVYYILYVENFCGKPYNFYVPDAKALPDGLRKGSQIIITFDLSYFKGNERLSVSKVETVSPEEL